MSWRVAILPCTIAGEVVTEEHHRGADWVLPEEVEFVEIARVARQCAWNLPLKIFTPSQQDWRLTILLHELEHEHHMDDDSYTILVRPVPKRTPHCGPGEKGGEEMKNVIAAMS